MNTVTTPHSTAHFSRWLRNISPGVLLSGILGFSAIYLAELPWFARHGLSALTIAMVLGLLIGNTVLRSATAMTAPGLSFTKQHILRTGIVLYGLRLTFQDIAHLGWGGIALDALVLTSTFGITCLLGHHWFKLDKRTTLLIGAGSSICGAAAVLATAPVVKGRSQDVSVAISTVVVFGTAGMFLYPSIYQWNLLHHWFDIDAHTFGVYIGATVHEVAQVVVAGSGVSPEATTTAVVAKMVRVMMLAPFLLALTFWIARSKSFVNSSKEGSSNITIPWFSIGFVLVAGVNSLNILPADLIATGTRVDNVLLAAAMAALGMTTNWHAVRAAGIKPLLLAAIAFAWLLGAGFALSQWLV